MLRVDSNQNAHCTAVV